MRLLLDLLQLIGLLLIVAALVALVPWWLTLAGCLLVAGLGVLVVVEVMEWLDKARAAAGGGRRWV